MKKRPMLPLRLDCIILIIIFIICIFSIIGYSIYQYVEKQKEDILITTTTTTLPDDKKYIERCEYTEFAYEFKCVYKDRLGTWLENHSCHTESCVSNYEYGENYYYKKYFDNRPVDSCPFEITENKILNESYVEKYCELEGITKIKNFTFCH